MTLGKNLEYLYNLFSFNEIRKLRFTKQGTGYCQLKQHRWHVTMETFSHASNWKKTNQVYHEWGSPHFSCATSTDWKPRRMPTPNHCITKPTFTVPGGEVAGRDRISADNRTLVVRPCLLSVSSPRGLFEIVSLSFCTAVEITNQKKQCQSLLFIKFFAWWAWLILR